MQWTVTTLNGTFDMPTSPIADYAGRMFDAKEILAEAISYWLWNLNPRSDSPCQ